MIIFHLSSVPSSLPDLIVWETTYFRCTPLSTKSIFASERRGRVVDPLLV